MLPASAINAMRRDVLNQMTALRARREDKPVRRAKEIPYYRGPAGQPGLTVQIMAKEQLTSRLLNSETSMLYVPLHILADDPKLCQKLAAGEEWPPCCRGSSTTTSCPSSATA